MRKTLRLLLLTAAALVAVATPAKALNNGLARTPPMGWDSWYAFHCGVTEQEVLDNARAIVASGMAQAGYRYVVVDGCWEAANRDANGNLQADPSTFPDGIAQLAAQIHALGLEFGIYTSAGRQICNHARPGSYGHFQADMKTFAEWGVDYVKVDWCDAAPGEKLRAAYAGIAAAAASSGKQMLVTVSTPGLQQTWLWAARDGNTWRIAADVTARWRSLMSVLDADAPLYPYAHPGAYNDADILQVGLAQLTASEARAQFSLWAMLASPLLAGNDLRQMSPSVGSILDNADVIAVDQDRLGRQGRRVSRADGVETWVRQLADGAHAVLVLDRGTHALRVGVDLGRLLGHAGPYAVRDLWSGRSFVTNGRLKLSVARHGVVMLRVAPTAAQ